MCEFLDGLRKDAEPTMVCFAEDFAGWKDFPKGLRVLLFNEDGPSAAEIKSKLEEMNYIVSLFCNEKEALEAVTNKAESYHVAMVEVTISNTGGSFRFLEIAKDLPTIMVSDVQCINTMMKCIALGAAEFLLKPLSEDKLRNIWQHVVHKAFHTGVGALSKSLKPVKETVTSMLQLQPDAEAAEPQNQAPSEAGSIDVEDHQEDSCRTSVTNDRFPAPSTPQLEQGGRLLDDGDCQDQPNFSMEEFKENVEDSMQLTKLSCSESKSVDNTCNDATEVLTFTEELSSTPGNVRVEEEVNSANGSNTSECVAPKEPLAPSSNLNNGSNIQSNAKDVSKKKSSPRHNSYPCGIRPHRKKLKVDWTPDLHRRFVQAVEQLGIDQAIPSKILELMKVEGLTRHNVASHLQKYRMHKRYILPKDDGRKWQHHRDSIPKGYPHKPFVAIPPHYSNCGLPPSHVYPVWGHPNYHSCGMQFWGHAGYQAWQPSTEYWPWKTYPRMHADAWGCPVVPPRSTYSTLPQINPPPVLGLAMAEDRNKASGNPYDLQLAEEVIDEVVKEAISKPWLPLPLGLKPPSTDSVLAELHRQGIRRIPPPHR